MAALLAVLNCMAQTVVERGEANRLLDAVFNDVGVLVAEDQQLGAFDLHVVEVCLLNAPRRTGGAARRANHIAGE